MRSVRREITRRLATLVNHGKIASYRLLDVPGGTSLWTIIFNDSEQREYAEPLMEEVLLTLETS